MDIHRAHAGNGKNTVKFASHPSEKPSARNTSFHSKKWKRSVTKPFTAQGVIINTPMPIPSKPQFGSGNERMNK
jgi:hypothetical protein